MSLSNKNILVSLLMILGCLCSQRTMAQVSKQKLHRPKVGVVLSGGGAKGLAHVGVLKVLEEAGIPVDYIAGNSMGSIVGALYAMGYSADALDSLARVTPWTKILADQIDRTNLNIEERENYYRTFIQLNFDKNGVQLPGGLVAGQSVTNLLNELCVPVYNIQDWSKLPIPFKCVATDIVTGKAVVLDHGYLPDALRASMSIPSFFTPVELDGKLLVDGLVINNYPVDVLKEMGADIIIGADVHGELAKKKDLNSMFAVLNQSMSFYGEQNYLKNKHMVDLNIRPNLGKLGPSDFDQVDSLITLGTKAAEYYLDDLYMLGDSLKEFKDYQIKQHHQLQAPHLKVNNVEFIGAKKVSKRRVKDQRIIHKGDSINFQTLKANVDRLYASGFYNKVSYKVLPSADSSSADIQFDTEPAVPGTIGIGVHYDPDFGPAILFQAGYNNLLTRDSRMNLAVKISKNLRIKSEYWWYGQKNIDYSFGLDFDQFRQTFQFQALLNEYIINSFTVDLTAHGKLSNDVLISAGPIVDFLSRTSTFEKELGVKDSTNGVYVGGKMVLLRDNLDQPHYPHRGSRVRADFRLTKYLGNQPINLLMNVKAEKAFPLSHNGTLILNGMIHVNSTEVVPAAYFALLGGRGDNFKLPGIHSLNGFHAGDHRLAAPNALMANVTYQQKLFKKNYLQIHFDAAKVERTRSQLFHITDLSTATSLTYGYNSFIGPIEFTGSYNSQHRFLAYLNIGFWI
ncbi:patatin-like phospholipase family protein [Persicobacter psychrovividus]|uniref:Patatin n=1 Tax=Persicobacter psychrovividus TaxID=387638 RepID=A0ABN6LIU9_9BACT|nr:patatin [Persicobacter psychrovividus]